MKKEEYDIAIQKADYKDLPIILEIQKSAFLEEAKFYNDYKIAPLTQSLDEIQKDYQDHLFLIATYLNQIVGSVKLREQDLSCWIGRLIVSPESIGYKKVEEYADENNPDLLLVKMIKNIRSTPMLSQ